MGVPLAVVDAFTDRAFSGNPAGVCRLDAPASEEWMLAVAAEVNLSETAFVSPRSDGDMDLRWFTPEVEVDLCGHATLATTHVLGAGGRFHTRSGVLITSIADDGTVTMDFPGYPVAPSDTAGWAAALGVDPAAVIAANRSDTRVLIEAASPADVVGARPNRDLLLEFGGFCLFVADTTSIDGGPYAEFDSVSRMFAPAAGIDEDPVTGSAHCVIAPWLAARTGRSEFVGRQVSKRGGTMGMRVDGDRVVLTGRAVTISDGTLHVDP